VIRDFIYLDVDWLRSLYSQAFEGVAEQMVRHTLDESARASSVPGATGEKLDTKVAEASVRSESTILHDHMYNRLEDRIGGAIKSPTAVTVAEYKHQLGNTFLLKVKGRAEIEDYDRIREFANKINEIGESIAYSALSTLEPLKELHQQIPDRIRALQQQLPGKSKSQKAEINKQISDLKNIQEPDDLLRVAADAMGLWQDPKSLSYINMWMGFFYPNGFEITIVPQPQTERVVFRGILNKRFLRLQPEYLRSIYAGFVSAEWVMVGQVTYLPGTKAPEMETTPLEAPAQSTSAAETSAATIATTSAVGTPAQPARTDNPLLGIQNEAQRAAIASVTTTPSETSPMRDPFRDLFKRASYFDRLFFESKFRVEVLVRPLAIYQEISPFEETGDIRADSNNRYARAEGKTGCSDSR